jgi:hypothetical protein
MSDNERDRGAAEGQRRECRGCGKEVVSHGVGRPRVFCDQCRQNAVLDQTPEGIERRRVYQKAYYARRKLEPGFMERLRAARRASYRRSLGLPPVKEKP